MSLPPFLLRKLQVLKYPTELKSLQSPHFQNLVLWLEEYKIRLWNEQDRLRMKNVVKDANKFIKIAKEYCLELCISEELVESLSDRNNEAKKKIIDTLGKSLKSDMDQLKIVIKSIQITV